MTETYSSMVSWFQGFHGFQGSGGADSSEEEFAKACSAWLIMPPCMVEARKKG